MYIPTRNGGGILFTFKCIRIEISPIYNYNIYIYYIISFYLFGTSVLPFFRFRSTGIDNSLSFAAVRILPFCERYGTYPCTTGQLWAGTVRSISLSLYLFAHLTNDPSNGGLFRSLIA